MMRDLGEMIVARIDVHEHEMWMRCRCLYQPIVSAQMSTRYALSHSRSSMGLLYRMPDIRSIDLGLVVVPFTLDAFSDTRHDV